MGFVDMTHYTQFVALGAILSCYTASKLRKCSKRVKCLDASGSGRVEGIRGSASKEAGDQAAQAKELESIGTLGGCCMGQRS